MNSINIKKKNIKRFYIFLLPTIFCNLNFNSHAEEAASPSTLESFKSNLDTLNSTTSTAKDTSKTISELSPKSDDANDNPKGKEAPPPPANEKTPEKPGGFFDRIFGRINSVQFNTQKEANNNSSILSELVIVYKPELFSQISSMTIKDWFTLKVPAMKTLRTSKDLQIYRFEITPDSAYTAYLIDINSGAVGAFLFNRLTNNLNSFAIQLNPYKSLEVSFFSLGFNYSQESDN